MTLLQIHLAQNIMTTDRHTYVRRRFGCGLVLPATLECLNVEMKVNLLILVFAWNISYPGNGQVYR